MSIFSLRPSKSRVPRERLSGLVMRLAQERPDPKLLASLEGRVWRALAKHRSQAAGNRFEDWATRVLTPEHRCAALTAAAVSGLLVVGLATAWASPAPAMAALNLHVFTSDAASPVYVMLKHQDKGAS